MEILKLLTPSETIQLKAHELEAIPNQSLVLDSEIAEMPKVIYGRSLSGKSVNKVGLKNLFESLCQNKAGVKIEDYTEGIITLTFESEAVKNRILRGQTWHFAGSYLILIEADAMDQITAGHFQQIPFWVQVYGIPPGLLAKPYGENLGKEIANSMGEFMEFDPTYRLSFMRFRVRLDSSIPLLRGKLLNLNKLKENMWVSFRYERLSKFCYFCGHLDHVQKDCAALMEEIESGHRPMLQYDVSLKTDGLGYVISPDVNKDQRSNRNSIAQIALEASRTSPKVQNLDPNAKRLKTGNTKDDNVGATINMKEQREGEEGSHNNIPSATKSITKGMKTSLSTQKPAIRGQNETGAKKD